MTPPQDLPQLSLLVCAYSLPDGKKIEMARQIEGPPLWVVRDGFGNCLSHDGAWEWEPMPSSRDDEFLARCRFNTAQAAYAVWAITGEAK